MSRKLLFSFIILSGCAAPELSQSWQLDRLRILAVQATPAEPQPGETVTFQSLVYMPPEQELEGVIWFACLPENADEFGCAIDADAFADVDPKNPDLDALIESGFIGFEPFLTPSWTPPKDLLDGFDERSAQEGLNALITLSALPTEAEDDGDVELAYKRLPVSRAQTPNNNPTILHVEVDGALLTDNTLFTTPGSEHSIDPVLSDDSVEEYIYISSDDIEERRTEEPYFTWYTADGTFDQTFSLYPYNDVVWTAPNRPSTGSLIVVARDRRGGMAWSTIQFVVE